MRIAIVSPNRDAYSETFIRAHIAGLKDVALVLTDGHLPHRDATGKLLLPGSMAARIARRMSQRTVEQELRSRIARRLHAERVDVLLAEYGPTGEALLEPALREGIPLVVHFHGIDAYHEDLLKKHRNYERLFAHAAAVVVVSRDMERQLLQLGCPPARLHYNCYGIDVDRFRTGNPAVAEPRFLSVGRFVDKKAPHQAILAFHAAWLREPSIRLTMVGDGPLFGSCVHLVRSLGLSEVVEFAGVLKPEDVAARMRIVRGFVQHSATSVKGDREGTPLAVLEAMASGLPVVATRHGGIPDVVQHGVTGLLSQELDILGMADHLVHLAQDAAATARMGEAAAQLVRERHTLRRSLDSLTDILRAARG
ncbi:MAG: glycosyltransferase [Flavobacteriales bacterium]|nr:glycosyltransferase [Flavobacteriales bacterium]